MKIIGAMETCGVNSGAREGREFLFLKKTVTSLPTIEQSCVGDGVKQKVYVISKRSVVI